MKYDILIQISIVLFLLGRMLEYLSTINFCFEKTMLDFYCSKTFLQNEVDAKNADLSINEWTTFWILYLGSSQKWIWYNWYITFKDYLPNHHNSLANSAENSNVVWIYLYCHPSFINVPIIRILYVSGF